MKKMYSILIAVLAFIFMGMIAEIVSLYGDKQAKKIAYEMVRQGHWEKGKPASLSLGDMLYFNVYAQGYKAGDFTPSVYKKGWRTKLVNNPQLAYATLQIYGKQIIHQYELGLIATNKELRKSKGGGWFRNRPGSVTVRLEHFDPDDPQPGEKNWTKDSVILYHAKKIKKWEEDSIAFMNNLTNFSIKDYWHEQRKVIAKYQLLINKLLSLPDKELNSYLKEVASGHSATETKKWLLKNKLIEKMPGDFNVWDENEQYWYIMGYPLDLLFLTNRINHDYPNWTARRFLTEVVKFSTAVEKILPQ